MYSQNPFAEVDTRVWSAAKESARSIQLSAIAAGIEITESVCNAVIERERSLTNQWFSRIADVAPEAPQIQEFLSYSRKVCSDAIDTYGQCAKVYIDLMRAGIPGKTAAVTPVSKPKPAVKAEAPAAKPEPVQAVAVSEPAPAPTPVTQIALPVDKAVMDDLRKISGIGAVLARKLNEYGVTSYGQIAAWTTDDIKRVEADVFGGNFAGRIQRESWIEQAKSLMTGA